MVPLLLRPANSGLFVLISSELDHLCHHTHSYINCGRQRGSFNEDHRSARDEIYSRCGGPPFGAPRRRLVAEVGQRQLVVTL
ncbi:unnamed protein product [Arctogadus glacialis]